MSKFYSVFEFIHFPVRKRRENLTPTKFPDFKEVIKHNEEK